MNQRRSKDAAEQSSGSSAEEQGEKIAGETGEADGKDEHAADQQEIDEPPRSEPIWVGLMILTTLAPVIVAIGLLLLKLSAHINAILHRAFLSPG